MLQRMRLTAELGPTKTRLLPAEMKGALLAAEIYVEPRPRVALCFEGKLAWCPAEVNRALHLIRAFGWLHGGSG